MKNVQEQYFEALFFNSPIAIITLDSKHKVVSVNPAFERIFGFSHDELLGKSVDDFITNDKTKIEAKKYTEIVQGGETILEQGQRVTKNGELVNVEIRGVPVVINSQQVGALGLYIDISERFASLKMLEESQAKYKSLFDYSPIALWEEDWSEAKNKASELHKKGVKDLALFFHEKPKEIGKFTEIVKAVSFNKAASHLFGAGSNSELVDNFHKTFTEASLKFFIGALCSFYAGEPKWIAETEMKTLDGRLIKLSLLASIPPVSENAWSTVYMSALDITETKRLQDELASTLREVELLAMSDGLTGLLNRRAITDQLVTELERSSRDNSSFGVALVDVDNLKGINDEFGHIGGDQALKLVSGVIKAGCRKYDHAGRWGGDEFMILFPNAGETQAQRIANRLCQSVRSKRVKGGETKEFPLSISIGVCIFSGDHKNQTLDQLISKVDEALYLAKDNGKNQAIVFGVNFPE